MGRGRRIALLVVLGLGVAWLWTGRAIPPRVEVQGDAPSAAEEERPEPELATPDVTPVAEEREARVVTPVAQVAPGARPPGARTRSGAPIAGRVVRPDGTPVVDAEVVLECAEPYRSQLGPLDATSTDARGQFTLDCGRTGPFRVEATERVANKVTGRVAREEVFPGGDELELVLESTVVRGRVVDDAGHAVTDYRLRWMLLAEGAKAQDMSDHVRSESGEFTSSLSPGAWRLEVQARMAPLQSAELSVSVPTTGPLTVVLLRQAIVQGTVVDAEGQPVSEAWIHRGEEAIGRSGPGGTFRVEVVPGERVVLAARHELHPPGAPVELSLTLGKEREGLVLRLGASARLTGEVLDPRGLPVSERKVEVRLRPAPGKPNGGYWAPVTDASGRFELEVCPGTLDVVVALSDAECSLLGRSGSDLRRCARRIYLQPGSSQLVRVELGGGPVRLHGRIRIEDRPLDSGNAHMTVRHATFSGPALPVRWSDGEYEVVLPEPGPYTLDLTTLDELHFRPEVEVPDGTEHRFDTELRLGRISGHVRDDSGAALEGITVDAMSEEPSPFPSSGRAVTDRQGAYSIPVVPGRYRVFPRADFEEERSLSGSEPRTVECASAAPGVDFELRIIGALTGVVGIEGDGELRDGQVIVGGAQGVSLHEVSGGDGSFHVPLDGGTYHVAAFGTFSERLFSTAEPVLVELAPGAKRTLELWLVATTEVHVRLSEASGEPVLETPLEALDERGRAYRFAPAEGAQVGYLGHLLPGSYTLRTVHGGRRFEQEFTLTPDETRRELEFRLD